MSPVCNFAFAMRQSSAMTDHVSDGSLNWALKHVQTFGDTDILPRPVEFDAVAANWDSVRASLARIDLNNYSIGAPLLTLAPKPRGTFRTSVQPAPLDSLLYLAMIFEIAGDVERARVPATELVACSYRLAPSGDGSLYRSQSGWIDFHSRSAALASDGRWSHVICADIASFFSHIYQHRLEAAIEQAGVRPDRGRSLQLFLSQFSVRQSIGLPVGPTASFVLAELLMNDVDRFLRQHTDVVHVRYIDDFRIFCPSFRAARRVLHDLSEYLYGQQRLTLATDKTRIHSAESFAMHVLRSPDDEVMAEEDRAANELLEALADTSPYESAEDVGLDDWALTEVQETALVRLFERSMEGRPPDVGTAKFLLRRATSLRTSALVSHVAAHLCQLVSALPSVERYLRVAHLERNDATALRRALRALSTTSSWADVPYVRLWTCEILRTCERLGTPDALMAIANAHPPSPTIRSMVLLAQRVGAVEVVRSHKEDWRALGEWDRRALIMSSSILPMGERRPWLTHVRAACSGLDKVLATYALSSP